MSIYRQKLEKSTSRPTILVFNHCNRDLQPYLKRVMCGHLRADRYTSISTPPSGGSVNCSARASIQTHWSQHAVCSPAGPRQRLAWPCKHRLSTTTLWYCLLPNSVFSVQDSLCVSIAARVLIGRKPRHQCISSPLTSQCALRTGNRTSGTFLDLNCSRCI